MKINRMFEIIYILLEKKKMTADELAQHFEVSKRTILRDIEALSMAGIPIYTTKGKGGGISLLDNYVLDKSVISQEEQNQILFALQSLAVTKQLAAPEALSKLQTLFGHADTSWIEVDFSRWGKIESDKQKFETSKNAILSETTISFLYSNSYGETSSKKIYPLKLLFKSQSWYIQGYCLKKKDYRIYKINRMNEITLLDQHFSRLQYRVPESNSTEVPFKAPLQIELLFSKEVAYRAYDEFHTNQIQKQADGSLLVVAELPEDYWLYSYLMSLGASVKVLSPIHVQDTLLAKIAEIKNNY